MSFKQCENINPELPTVGLFGTCGNSNWREAFIKKYEEFGIQFFNPNKKDWTPEDAEVESVHLAEDDVVLFPILSSELGIASLSETSFSIVRALTDRRAKFTVIYIEDIDYSQFSAEDQGAAKKSQNAREIIKSHLDKLDDKVVYVVDSLDEMLQVSISLHDVVSILNDLKNKRFN